MTAIKPVPPARELPAFFLEWRKGFIPGGESFTPLTFLDQQAAIPFLLAAAWLFCPEVTEYRGGAFRTDGFAPENVDEWLASVGELHG